MNKKILAVAISGLLATSAQAVNLYEEDGIKVEMSGLIEVMYKTDIGVDEKSTIDIDDADVNFSLAYDIGHNLTALGVVEFDGNSGTTERGDIYVGLSSADMGTLTIGQQIAVNDDAGIADDFEFGIDTGFNQAADGPQVVRYTLDKGMFYGGVSYILNTAAGVETDDDSALAGQFGVRVEDLDVTLYAGQEDRNANTSVSNVMLQAKYTLSDLTLGASVGSTSGENAVKDVTTFGLSVLYQMDKAKFAAGFSSADTDGADDNVDEYFLNAGYAFTSNVTTYVEIGGNNKKVGTEDTDIGYNVGMKVSF
jgi:predicted porin